jgi:hygromycin-B 7''-O-kinase
MSHPPLPPEIGVSAFDALHDDPLAWRAVMESIAAEHGAGPLQQMEEGTVLVALLGRQRVIKLYPPFLRDHFEFERGVLAQLGGRLSVPTPTLEAVGSRDGWPYLVMSQLSGEPMTAVWPTQDEKAKCKLLRQIGSLAAEVHAQPVGPIHSLAPPWLDFIAAQRARCVARQQRTGLPEQLLQRLPAFLEGELPQGPAVILTGEYTPMNLLVAGERLVGMYDFGDGLVGPGAYDWLGPLVFLAAGHAARREAFFEGYGVKVDAQQRLALLRLVLLHRYSNLKAQIALPGWQQAQSFEELALRIWP